jgi:hypothetical protein
MPRWRHPRCSRLGTLESMTEPLQLQCFNRLLLSLRLFHTEPLAHFFLRVAACLGCRSLS